MSGDADFDSLYRGARSTQESPALAPWDIGGPQPVVQQLVAYGALRGKVLDPGTGPGHHAIYYASKGYSATGIDESPTAIERARRNAERAGVEVNFQVGDVTELAGFEDQFDTVVDVACYHVFDGDDELQTRYAQALHRATKPGARLFMFEDGRGNINGLQLEGVAVENFERVLPTAGWRIEYLGTATYQSIFSPEVFAHMYDALAASNRPQDAELIRPWEERIRMMEPLLENHRVHLPIWVVHATRVD
ncbi:class I SAM-dependent methyltransferase [Mycobacterium sp. pUA109]|uniref:class I SAM-dependent methyltransferase n=1 Tax=Mycobacterium sp. pUA109 TaxID=3238982 RepID=UPI00351ACB5C